MHDNSVVPPKEVMMRHSVAMSFSTDVRVTVVGPTATGGTFGMQHLGKVAKAKASLNATGGLNVVRPVDDNPA